MAICPACGMKVKSDEDECPHCGWVFERAAEFDCPFCGELIPAKSKKCPKCGIDLSKLSAKGRSQSIDKIREVLMADLTEFEELEGEKKFTCPKCAKLLDGHEPKCPDCGQVLIGKAGLRCPVCATPVGRRRKNCPNCGIALGSIAKEALRMVPYVPERVSGHMVQVEVPPGSMICPMCGAMVQGGLTRCPLCDSDLMVEKAEPEAVVTPAVPEGPAEEIAELPRPQITREVEEPQAEQEPELEKTTTVDYGARTAPRGLSNGVGQVNGRGRTNGMGAVNGRSFVNGTGISNGLGPRAREAPGKRPSFPTRWQLLAVLVALVVVISAFVFLSYSGEKDRFAIDGDYADWDGATSYGSRIESTSPSSNIIEWSVGAQSSDLFLYFRTQSQMMSSSAAESYYLFVDSDGSDDTGYVMESMGADYMLQITGWDNAVNSTSLYRYSSEDQFDWNAWSSSGSLTYSTDGVRVEAQASMAAALSTSARFLLMSKDSLDRGSISYLAPLKGAVLVVEQIPSDEVALDSLVPKATSVAMLNVRFTSEGGAGSVDDVNPVLVGAPLAGQISSFSLSKGETKEITIALDTSAVTEGRFVSAELFVGSIDSSYSSTIVTGSSAGAYVVSPPSAIFIDGAFADWYGRLSVDQDTIPVPFSSVDIDEVGNVNTSQNSFFYISVEGEMCSGTYVPASVARPSGAGGGGGVVIPTKHSAEDVMTVYVDSDKSNSTGQWVTLGLKEIGADKKIEIKGLFGRITSMKEYDYSSSGTWVEMTEAVDAAKDAKRMEISVTSASLDSSVDIDYIVETTSWKGQADLAIFDPSSMSAYTNTWIVDSITTSPWATSMSFQRKMFYDGSNYWSFYFNGKDTVCKYSPDEGQTWTFSGRVFTTQGVNQTSIWYDASTSTVYAVGDISRPSHNVSVQMGVVDAAAHAISWASSDTILNSSRFPMAGKSTYISKDSNGYLWVLSSNYTEIKPQYFDLSAFRSTAVDSISSWTNTGQILPYGQYLNNSKGSIVPAGSGSDMWAVYTYYGYVAAKKYNGAWPADWDETVIFRPGGGQNIANTDNSPPSVVVDGKGVVHVVYGTDRADKTKRSIPQIEYSHNETDSRSFTPGLNLDPTNDSLLIGNYYPSISLETSTDNLYVMWLQSDATLAPKTVLGRVCVSGTWSSMTIEPQTTFTKQYLTSIYSVSGEFKICWQWTQNTTVPIEVIFDSTWIPEFGDLALPMLGLLFMFAVYRQKSRGKRELTD